MYKLFFSAHSSVETFGQKSGAKRGVQENRSSNQVIYQAEQAAICPGSTLPRRRQAPVLRCRLHPSIHLVYLPTNMRCPPRHLGGPYYTHLRLDPCHVKWVCLVTLSSRNNFLIIFKKLAWMVAHLLVVCLLHIMVSPYPIVQLLAQNACSKRVTIRCTFLNFPAFSRRRKIIIILFLHFDSNK